MTKRHLIRGAAAVVVGLVAALAPGAAADAAEPAPTAVADLYETQFGELLLFGGQGVLANDVPGTPGDVLTARLVDPPDHGTLVLGTDGGFHYVASGGFTGDDTFAYAAVGSTGVASAPATVTMRTTPVQQDPREPTRVTLGPARLVLLGVSLEARVTTLAGAGIGGNVDFTQGSQLLCHGQYNFITGVSTCVVPLVPALPILFGGQVTATFYGNLVGAPSSVTGRPALKLL